MWKKFLAVMAIIGLFTTATASAVDVGGEPGGGGNGSQVISGFAVSPASFNPGAGQTATASYTLSVASNVYVYAVSSNFDVIEIAGTAVAPVAASAGSVTHSWNGKKPNTAAGTVVADGTYTVKAFAYNAAGSIVGFASSTVTVTSTPVVDPNVPHIADLKVNPLIFSASTDQTTAITFDVDKDAFLTVTVEESAKGGGVAVRSFTDYDGNDFYLGTAVHSITWNGTNNSGTVVADGEYSVKVKAQNDAGSTTETTTLTVKTDGPAASGVIEDFTISPSSVWDPTEEELQIEFELTDDVKSLTIDAKKGNSVIEILDDEFVDEDDYEESWDGTDDDGDYVNEGDWQIILRADAYTVTKTVKIEYEKPDITNAFVTKDSVDPSEDEFTNLVFKVDAASEVTVEVYKGSKKEATLWDEVEVKKNSWYAVKWDAMEDGEEVDEGQDWKFKITAENGVDNDVEDVQTVELDVEDDEVSDKKSNVTNDYTEPVVFDDESDESMTVYYCIEGDADVFLAIYEGASTTGKAEIELLDYVAQDAGCHSVQWNGRDEDNKKLKDGVYSYKLVSRASGNHKDTEVGKFAVGNSGDVDQPEPPKPPQPPAVSQCSDGLDNDFDGTIDYYGVPGYAYDLGCDSPEDDDESDDYVLPPEPPVATCGGYWDTNYLSYADYETCAAIEWATVSGIFNGYADGSFAPNNTINRAEVLKVVIEAFDGAVLLPLDGSNQGFWDVDTDSWYMPYVRTAKFYGMLHGYPDGSARLWNNINRVEFLKFVLEAAEQFAGYYIPTYNFSYYVDVNVTDPSQSWFKDYAGVAYDYMLFNEKYVGNSYYLEPGALVTRGEVALLLYRMSSNGLLGGYYYDYPMYEEMVPMYY